MIHNFLKRDIQRSVRALLILLPQLLDMLTVPSCLCASAFSNPLIIFLEVTDVGILKVIEFGRKIVILFPKNVVKH